jgi:hypothetical protein
LPPPSPSVDLLNNNNSPKTKTNDSRGQRHPLTPFVVGGYVLVTAATHRNSVFPLRGIFMPCPGRVCVCVCMYVCVTKQVWHIPVVTPTEVVNSLQQIK